MNVKEVREYTPHATVFVREDERYIDVEIRLKLNRSMDTNMGYAVAPVPGSPSDGSHWHDPHPSSRDRITYYIEAPI